MFNQVSDLWQLLELASEVESDLWDTQGSGLLILMLEKFSWFCLTSLITLVLLMWKWMGLFSRKNNFLRCWGWLCLPNWIGALTLSLSLKLPQRKLEPWFVFEVPVYWGCPVSLWIYHAACMKYCCHVWAGAPSWYLKLLDKL